MSKIDLPITSLSDEELLVLCEKQLEPDRQEELSLLLEMNREGSLRQVEEKQLDELIQLYRSGLIRKAQAWETAVARGLKM